MERVDGLEIFSNDGVYEAVIDRGEGNLFTAAMCDALAACLTEPPLGAHLLRLRAKGPIFCLGRERTAVGERALRKETEALIRLNEAIRSSPLITVAEIQGNAAGYGVGLAALCDIAIAAPSTQFRFPEVDMGLAPSIVLAWLGPMVGRKQALLLTATGEAVDARRAAEIGLITEVTADDESLSASVDARINALRTRSQAVHRDIKGFLTMSSGMPPSTLNSFAAEKLINASLSLQQEDITSQQ